MSTASSDHAVVSDDCYVIATGGHDEETSVEIFISPQITGSQ